MEYISKFVKKGMNLSDSPEQKKRKKNFPVDRYVEKFCQ